MLIWGVSIDWNEMPAAFRMSLASRLNFDPTRGAVDYVHVLFELSAYGQKSAAARKVSELLQRFHLAFLGWLTKSGFPNSRRLPINWLGTRAPLSLARFLAAASASCPPRKSFNLSPLEYIILPSTPASVSRSAAEIDSFLGRNRTTQLERSQRDLSMLQYTVNFFNLRQVGRESYEKAKGARARPRTITNWTI